MRLTRLFTTTVAAASMLAMVGSGQALAADTGSTAGAGAVQAGVLTAPVRTPFPGKTATQIKNLSAATALKAKTVRVSGYVLDTTSGRMDLDIRIGATGAVGSFTISKPTKGTAKVIRIGNTIYLQGDQGLLGNDAAPGGAMYQKWVKIDRTNKDYLEIARMTTIKAWGTAVQKLTVSRRYAGPKLTGVPTVRLYQPGRKGGNLYVAASGPAFPRLVQTTDKTTRMAFSEWNRPVAVSAPPADQVIALAPGA